MLNKHGYRMNNIKLATRTTAIATPDKPISIYYNTSSGDVIAKTYLKEESEYEFYIMTTSAKCTMQKISDEIYDYLGCGEFEDGSKVKIIDKTSGHAYKIGETVTIKKFLGTYRGLDGEKEKYYVTEEDGAIVSDSDIELLNKRNIESPAKELFEMCEKGQMTDSEPTVSPEPAKCEQETAEETLKDTLLKPGDRAKIIDCGEIVTIESVYYTFKRNGFLEYFPSDRLKPASEKSDFEEMISSGEAVCIESASPLFLPGKKYEVWSSRVRNERGRWYGKLNNFGGKIFGTKDYKFIKLEKGE